VTAVKIMRVAAPAGVDDTQALRIRASFGQLARELAASRLSCATARECVDPCSPTSEPPIGRPWR
jgi:hypothetical protein